MYSASTIFFLATTFSTLLVVACWDKIDRFMERTFSPKAILRAADLRDILLIALALILAALVGALSMLDWVSSLSFAVIAVLIMVLILNLRHKSEYRQQWLNAQSMYNLVASIKSAVKEVLKEDREENIASMKKAFKEALKEDREETDNSKRGSQ